MAFRWLSSGSSIENIWWKADVQLDLNVQYKVYVTGRHRQNNESSPVVAREIWDNDETIKFGESSILTHYQWGSNNQITASDIISRNMDHTINTDSASYNFDQQDLLYRLV